MSKWHRYLPAALLAAFGAALTSAGAATVSPFASEVVAHSSNLDGSGDYNDPQNLLGKPSLDVPGWMGWPGGKVKVTEGAFGAGRVTTITTGSYVTVKFDHQVEDDPNNPFGIDLLVFGNAFYLGAAGGDATDMATQMLSGAISTEPVTVSVSQDGVNWYTYADGPFADGTYPTQAYEWDQAKFDATGNGWADEMDFTKPVDPALQSTLFAGGSVSGASVIAAYDGSGGGTGFDLAESGYSWIQYVKVEGNGGEIDAFADVAPVPEPASLLVVAGAGLVVLVRRCRVG